jgi:DNA ligase-associated metallophosphoesterase
VSNNTSFLNIVFATHKFTLDAAGALYWPQEKTLVVSDLHLEKGSYFAERQQLLPSYDTKDTLDRIETLLQHYQPERLICLGDNLHDKNALTRMQKPDYAKLIVLYESVKEWIWIIGNHDTKDLAVNPLAHMRFEIVYQLHDIIFTHEFIAGEPYQIGGHFHPKITISVNNTLVTGKCFMVTDNKIIMPAFGTYTGGLNTSNPIFEKTLQTKEFKGYLFHKNNIKRVK